jgi:hypothetical protein
MLSQLDNDHMSSLDKSFHLTCVYMHTEICEIFSLIFNQNSVQVCYPQIFKFTISFPINSIQEPDSTSLRLLSDSSLALLQPAGIDLCYGLPTLPQLRPFFLQFILYTTKQIVSSPAHTFSLHIYSGITKKNLNCAY